jgi:hypothetical protein
MKKIPKSHHHTAPAAPAAPAAPGLQESAMVAVSRASAASTYQAATRPGGSQALGEEDPPAELRNGHHLFRQRHCQCYFGHLKT